MFNISSFYSPVNINFNFFQIFLFTLGIAILRQILTCLYGGI